MCVFFVTASPRNFFYVSIAASFERVRITCDIAATNRSEIATGVQEQFLNRDLSTTELHRVNRPQLGFKPGASFSKVPRTFQARKASFCVAKHLRCGRL